MKNYLLIKVTKATGYSDNKILNVFANKYDAYKTALNLIKETFLFESTLPSKNLHLINNRYDLYEQIFDAALNKAYRKALNMYNTNAFRCRIQNAWSEYEIVPYEVIETPVELNIPTNLVNKQKVFK